MAKRRRGHELETIAKRATREDVRDEPTKDNKIVFRIAWIMPCGCGNPRVRYV